MKIYNFWSEGDYEDLSSSLENTIVFDQGKIVEDGTHKKLLDKNGMYKTLWDAQVGGFLPD